MNWDDIKDTVSKYAPTVATILGGPQGAAVGALVSTALGTENSPQQVVKALERPQNQVKINQFENDNKVKLQEIALSRLQEETRDRQDAREHNDNSEMPKVVLLLLSFMSLAYGGIILSMEIPPENRDLVTYFAGQLLTLWAGAVAYWVGTSRGETFKNGIINKFSK